jgi:putative transposase
MRRHRIEYDGAVYHVIQRSSNREVIFGKVSDKDYFIDLLAGYKKKLGFRLFGFVLMDNHYHLLLQTGAIPLSKIMQRINLRYSKFYNQKYNRHGHVFGGRYKAGLVQDESYLFAILRYIHQNPVQAGICKQVNDYEWSSDPAYQANKEGITDISFVLDTLSDNRMNAIEKYKRLIGEEVQNDFNYEKHNLIGDEDFRESKRKEIAYENRNLGRERKILADLLQLTEASKDEQKLILSGSRKRSLQDYKRKFALEARAEGYTFKEIGAYINISDAAVNKLISK